MYFRLVSAFVFAFLPYSATAQKLTPDIPYVENGHKRHVLDIYTPEAPGWEEFARHVLDPRRWMADRGQERCRTEAQGADRTRICLCLDEPPASAGRENGRVDWRCRQILGWVHRNIAKYGGDPTRIFVGGHSSGAQLAALICIDDRYLKKEGMSFDVLKGCVPVDGDTYDIPKIIMTAEHRQALYGGKMFTFGHRQKFGNDPEKHVDFSAVTHVAKGQRNTAVSDPVFFR